jgi:hypothetical protein
VIIRSPHLRFEKYVCSVMQKDFCNSIGTNAKCRLHRAMFEFGGQTEDMCSTRRSRAFTSAWCCTSTNPDRYDPGINRLAGPATSGRATASISHDAVGCDRRDRLRTLLAHDPGLANASDEDGGTPLHRLHGALTHGTEMLDLS